jgi:Phosphatidylethanolamine-binding protein
MGCRSRECDAASRELLAQARRAQRARLAVPVVTPRGIARDAEARCVTSSVTPSTCSNDGFIHWAAYSIPASATGLAENAGASEPDLGGGGRHAWNDFLKRRYDGPCPPRGRRPNTASPCTHSTCRPSTTPARP